MSASNRSFRRRLSCASIAPGSAPEEAVVDDQQVGALAGGELEQLRAGRDAGGDRLNLGRARDLQAVGAVVLEAPRLEQVVELREDLGGGGA